MRAKASSKRSRVERVCSTAVTGAWACAREIFGAANSAIPPIAEMVVDAEPWSRGQSPCARARPLDITLEHRSPSTKVPTEAGK
jgi:hypothetical protein